MHTTRSPIVCATTYETVMEAAGWMCQCAGGLCGSRHSKSGLRCDREQGGHVRLIAAPADLTLSPVDAVRVPVPELRAWCSDCHRKAAARARAADANARRIEAGPADTLF